MAQLSSYVVERESITSLSVRNAGITDQMFGRLALAIQIGDAKPRVRFCHISKSNYGK